jgi:hypothetical protein
MHGMILRKNTQKLARLILFSLLVILLILATGCTLREHPGDVVLEQTLEDIDLPAPPSSVLTEHEFEALSTIERVDEYPLYVMTLTGPFRSRDKSGNTAESLEDHPGFTHVDRGRWACSLFTALGDPGSMVFGRNFDWRFSPALLLFTHPPDGYASVSMVDIGYLLDEPSADAFLDLEIDERTSLLEAPFWPFDGMNERGVAIGMAAVPASELPFDKTKDTLDSLQIMREVLDHASSTVEAVEIFKTVNIDMGGGPFLHYVITDATGDAVIIEFLDGSMVEIWQEKPWLAATNYLLSDESDGSGDRCWRYETIVERMDTSDGRIDSSTAMSILREIAQENTQWSVVYEVSERTIEIVMGRDYQTIHKFQLD